MRHALQSKLKIYSKINNKIKINFLLNILVGGGLYNGSHVKKINSGCIHFSIILNTPNRISGFVASTSASCAFCVTGGELADDGVIVGELGFSVCCDFFSLFRVSCSSWSNNWGAELETSSALQNQRNCAVLLCNAVDTRIIEFFPQYWSVDSFKSSFKWCNNAR